VRQQPRFLIAEESGRVGRRSAGAAVGIGAGDPVGAGRQIDLAAEDVPAQARGKFHRGVVRQHEPEPILGQPQQREQRHHAALGREPSAPLPAAGRQRANVVHELGLREGCGVGARQRQDAEAIERGKACLQSIRVERHGGGGYP
jgi:hypothetical protein